MTEIDVLNGVKFTGDDGIMHLFPPEKECQESFLRFRYLLTEIDAETRDSLLQLDCTIRERAFFIPDGGISLYKDVYRLDPVAFVQFGNGDCRNDIEENLRLLGYSGEEIAFRLWGTKDFFKFIPMIDTNHLYSLEKGETFADAWRSLGVVETDFKISVWSPDLTEGMSLENFFGDEKAWEKERRDYDRINCINDVGWTLETIKIIKGTRGF